MNHIQVKCQKPENSKIGLYDYVVEYCQNVVYLVNKDETLMVHQNVKETLNLLQETINDVNEELLISKDTDDKIGHKTADTSYFGYKTHLAMTSERIITAATVHLEKSLMKKNYQHLLKKWNQMVLRWKI